MMKLKYMNWNFLYLPGYVLNYKAMTKANLYKYLKKNEIHEASMGNL